MTRRRSKRNKEKAAIREIVKGLHEINKIERKLEYNILLTDVVMAIWIVAIILYLIQIFLIF